MDILIKTKRIESNNVQYFSKEWYYETGVTISITVLGTCIFSPLLNFISWDFIKLNFRRMKDRGCCHSDRKRTKKVLQRDYERVYDGLTFELEARYAKIISIVGIIMTFSLAMPLL